MLVDKVRWPFPNNLNSFIWRLTSRFTITIVGCISKFVLKVMNRIEVRNLNILTGYIDERPSHVPLITVINHASCFDDPGLWGVLPFRYMLNPDKIRWSLAAHDICFTNPIFSQFFARGQCIPVIRGDGVYQKAMDFCISLLNRGSWVHIFPEGRVNEKHEFIRFKWGIGRLIAESTVMPIIIPMWHVGMDKVLPNVLPYRFKWGNKVLLNIGKPIDLTEVMNSLKKFPFSNEQKHKIITDKIQDELMKLKEQTEGMY